MKLDAGETDSETVVPSFVKKIDFDVVSFVEGSSSADKGLSCDCEILVRSNRQSASVVGGVDVGKGLDVGVNDHEILFGYGCNETDVDDLNSIVSSVDSK